MAGGYTVPRVNPGKKSPLRVGDLVADDDARLYRVTHMSDRALAVKDMGGRVRNFGYADVRRVKRKPLEPGAIVRKGKAEYKVVRQEFDDAVLVVDMADDEHEFKPSRLRVVQTARHARRHATTPAPRPQQAVPAPTQRGLRDDEKHDMTPVIAVHGNGQEDRVGFAWTAAEADKLLRRFHFSGRAARAQMADGEKVYIGPVGDTQRQLDAAIYELAQKRRLSSRPNPATALRKGNVVWNGEFDYRVVRVARNAVYARDLNGYGEFTFKPSTLVKVADKEDAAYLAASEKRYDARSGKMRSPTMATKKTRTRKSSGRKAKRSPAQIAATKKMLAAAKKKRTSTKAPNLTARSKKPRTAAHSVNDSAVSRHAIAEGLRGAWDAGWRPKTESQWEAVQKYLGKKPPKKYRGVKIRKNPVRTAAGRVLEARGGKKLASKLMLMRKQALARGEEPPQRIRRRGGGWMTYESAQLVLQGRGVRGSGKTGTAPRKRSQTSGRRSSGSRGGPDVVTYLNREFGLG